ncbi:unnamed protein product [Eruca vesicaria subsp. sativa]|uniref:Uncharacterized protein n=1 Tax=Eruca vesicaria subsp. sativa TaxID=29727 RepID=A0ABC8LN03_ERUVS|nr:unnamed protein product [Eruca vesicaria subsp. sativa]
MIPAPRLREEYATRKTFTTLFLAETRRYLRSSRVGGGRDPASTGSLPPRAITMMMMKIPSGVVASVIAFSTAALSSSSSAIPAVSSQGWESRGSEKLEPRFDGLSRDKEHETNRAEHGDVVNNLDSALNVDWTLIPVERSCNSELRLARWIAVEGTRRDGDSELLDGCHSGVRVTVENTPNESRSWSGPNRAQPRVEVSRWSRFKRGRDNFVISYSLPFLNSYSLSGYYNPKMNR